MQSRAEQDNPFSQLASNAVLDALQEMVGLFGSQGTLLTHIQLAIHQKPQIPFWVAVLQPLIPHSVYITRNALSQVQNLALALVKLHAALLPTKKMVELVSKCCKTLLL